MTNLSDPIEDVRVIPAHDQPAPAAEPAPTQERSEAMQIRATILDTAEDKLRQGRDLIVEGLEMFGVVDVPQHPNLPTLIGQQIEQVIEFRRLKS